MFNILDSVAFPIVMMVTIVFTICMFAFQKKIIKDKYRHISKINFIELTAERDKSKIGATLYSLVSILTFCGWFLGIIDVGYSSGNGLELNIAFTIIIISVFESINHFRTYKKLDFEWKKMIIEECESSTVKKNTNKNKSRK